ncbi:MAG: hypothetical protein OXB88_07690 [Bacteriovoracales bacterium]|nr:hypothetical protein [Bacteriovoracales bacterium]
MAKFKHLNKSKLDYVTERLCDIEGSLDGLGALFLDQGGHHCPSSNELFGLGLLIKGQARELSILGDILQCGHDSRAVTENWKKDR